MTILQLKYIITLSASSSMREASSKLYVSQPALSTSIKELEEELGIKLFERNNKGIILTEKGKEFVNFAKQAVSQYELIEHKYLREDHEKEYYTISMQHYVFAVHAFANAVKKSNPLKYSFFVNETKTDEVLYAVRDYKSEVGVLSYSEKNSNLMKKLLREYELEFYPLMVCDTYAYLSKQHPLASRNELSVEELRDYPCVSFDQENEAEFYLSEEALSDYSFDKVIRSNDRATSCEILTMFNGFAIGIGNMIDSYALNDSFLSIKLKEEDPLTIGYIIKKNHKLSDLGKLIVEELNKYNMINKKK